MLKKEIMIVIVAVAACLLSAAELPETVKISNDGSFRIGEAEFCIQNYSPSWKPASNSNWQNRKVKWSKNGLTLSAVMPVDWRKADAVETITPTGDAEFQLDFQAKFREPTVVNALHGVFLLPAGKMTVFADGKPVSLPERYSAMTLLSRSNVKEFRFPVEGGYEVLVSGNPLRLTIQDNRKFDSDTFSFRFGAEPGSGKIKESKLALSFRIIPVKLQPVNLKKTANMDFADEAPGDGKGGWTDQGPENDLRKLKPGTVRTGALSFEVLDPAKNGGRAALVLAGKQRGFAIPAATLALPVNRAGAVNLLHASAWTPANGTTLGTVIAQYTDGSSVRIPVVAGRDCGNWWNPFRGKNAAIVWSVENPEALVGLYASSFALPKPGPKSLHFETATPETVWMIVGVTLSDKPIRFAAVSDNPLEMKANYEWKPLAFQRRINRGSALDFSFLADAPAGKYGFIRPTPEGTLTFEKAPQKRIRLYGPNLCFSASFLKKETVDQLADYFVYCGYNTVRIHHHDTELLDRKAKDTLTFSAAKLDQLDYLVYRMKEKGIYVTTDLYTNRVFKPGDNIPECDFYDQRQMKILLPVSRAAMENWKEFARRWMSHKNPYTGLTWAEEPALYCINLVNEETLTSHWNRTSSSVKLYEAAFAKYCAKKRLKGGAASNTNPVFVRFLYELQDRVLAEQIRFVKETLGVKAMVTSLNYLNQIPLALLRRRFDLVDNHVYFDHPGFPEKPWSHPFSYRQYSAIRQMAVVPRNLMATRLPGKPFIVTEFNYCNPNLYRAEGGSLIGAYAALQNWDALYRFAWSHSASGIYKVGGAYGFDAVNDPMAQLSDRIAIAMFRRGDVAPAKVTYAYTVSPDCWDRGEIDAFPVTFQNLGLVTGIGSIPEGDRSVPRGTVELTPAQAKNPAALKDARIAKLWREANDKRLAVSATGQLRLDGNAGSFTVTTPRTESITLPAGSLAAGTLRVKEASCFQTVAAISLDDKPLAESASVLVIQLTNVANTGLLFTNESRKIVTKTGHLPLLVKKGRATVELASARPYRVTALNCDGAPCGEVKGVYRNGLFRFTADTTQFPGGVMAYHLTR